MEIDPRVEKHRSPCRFYARTPRKMRRFHHDSSLMGRAFGSCPRLPKPREDVARCLLLLMMIIGMTTMMQPATMIGA